MAGSPIIGRGPRCRTGGGPAGPTWATMIGSLGLADSPLHEVFERGERGGEDLLDPPTHAGVHRPPPDGQRVVPAEGHLGAISRRGGREAKLDEHRLDERNG